MREGISLNNEVPVPGKSFPASLVAGVSIAQSQLDAMTAGWVWTGHDEDASTILAQAEFALSDRHQAGTDGSAQDTTMRTPATSLSADAPAFVPLPHAPQQWSFRSGGGGQEGPQACTTSTHFLLTGMRM